MKEKKYLILEIATVLITLIVVTYAYFTTRIIGDRKNVTVDMAELKIIFTNGDAIEDKFSVNNSGGGNGKLTYPVALIAMDEAVFSGIIPGVYANNDNGSDQTWLYRNSNGGSITGTKLWWLISSFYWNISRSYVFRVVGFGEPGYLDYIGVDVSEKVRPAISLSSCVTIKSGTGTPETPYEIDYDGSCN